MLAYLDTSALVKLVLVEPESAALTAQIANTDLVTSALARTELRRAVGRAGLTGGRAQVDAVLDRLTQLVVNDEILDRAGALAPPEMRSLDAIHVASAAGLGDRLDVVVTYDNRMTAAARLHGLDVIAPGT